MGLFDKFKKPKWEDEDWKVRREAVKGLHDQKILINIAKNDSDSSVRRAAIGNISNESVLIDIAKKDKVHDNRSEAVRKINNEKVIAGIAKNDPHYMVRNEALRNISDESILIDIAMYSKYEDTRMAAIKYVSKSSLKNIKSNYDLIKITECADLSTVEKILEDIDDDLVLYNVWENNKKEEVKVFITKKIKDEEILSKIAQTFYPDTNHSSYGRTNYTPCGLSYKVAINKITNQELLKNIIENPAERSYAADVAKNRLNELGYN